MIDKISPALALIFVMLISVSASAFNFTPRALACSPEDKDPLKCLVCSLYFEARGESLEGLIEVGLNKLTRIEDRNYPNTMCELTWANRQYEWTQDGKVDHIPYKTPRDRKTLKKVINAAMVVSNSAPSGFTNFYNPSISSPEWGPRCKRSRNKKVGGHLFCNLGYKPGRGTNFIRDRLVNMDPEDLPIPTPSPRRSDMFLAGKHLEMNEIPVPQRAPRQELSGEGIEPVELDEIMDEMEIMQNY